jgi:hypothetical protein
MISIGKNGVRVMCYFLFHFYFIFIYFIYYRVIAILFPWFFIGNGGIGVINYNHIYKLQTFPRLLKNKKEG